MMKRKKKEIEISKDDLKIIYGGDNDFFQDKIISNCHCIDCTEKHGKDGYTIDNSLLSYFYEGIW
jgi:hypothetical protein